MTMILLRIPTEDVRTDGKVAELCTVDYVGLADKILDVHGCTEVEARSAVVALGGARFSGGEPLPP